MSAKKKTKKKPPISDAYVETRCSVCSDAITVRKDVPGPHLCGAHAAEANAGASKRKKKKDFSEAIAASAEEQDVAHARANGSAPRTQSVVIRKVKHKVPVRIDDAAAAAKGEQLAEVCEQRLAVKAERRETIAKFKEKIAGLDERERELSASVKMHTEPRDVLCAERLTPQNEVEIVRLDTGEIVTTRPAEARDLQPELFEKATKGEAEWSEGPNPLPKAGASEERADA